MNKRDRGAAFLLVIGILVMLTIIAIPFTISMIGHRGESSSQMARSKAQFAAEGAFNHAVATLIQGHEALESQVRPKPNTYDNPNNVSYADEYDGLDELAIKFKDIVPSLDLTDSKGELWSAYVEDEQGKINVNSATPWLLGNLIASSIVTENVKEEDKEIHVDSTEGFNPKGGFLWVDGELISYKEASANTFKNCERGLFADTTPLYSSPMTITKGSLIIDARAYRICRHPYLIQPGYFIPYKTVEEIKQIAEIGAYSFSAEEFERFVDFLTVYSERFNASGWIHTQKILNDLPDPDETRRDYIKINNAVFYGRGLCVKIENKEGCEYATLLAKKGVTLFLDQRLSRKFLHEESYVSALEPYPININTTPPKVLFALFKGLSISSKDWVDQKEAGILTEEIIASRENLPFKSLESFKKFLEVLQKKLAEQNVLNQNGDGQALSDYDISAILCNALSTTGTHVQYGQYTTPRYPTAPFTFKSSNVYTVEATGVINASSGAELAKHTFRRVVNVAPLRTSFWRLRSQSDFNPFIERLPSYHVITWPNLVAPFITFSSTSREETSGYLRLEAVNFSSLLSGYMSFEKTHEGVTDLPLKFSYQSLGTEIAPGAIDFWMKPEKGRGTFYLFDMGEKEWENRVLCYIDGSTGEIVLSIRDATIAQMASEIRFEFRPGPYWYHIMAGWQSTSPGELYLGVDGMPVGNWMIRDSQNHVICATLLSSISTTDDTVRVDSTRGFPDEGIIQIGSEVIEYESKSTGFKVRKSYPEFSVSEEYLGRGKRGTSSLAHPAGAMVSLAGYSLGLTGDLKQGGGKLKEDLPENPGWVEADIPFPSSTSIKIKEKAKQFQGKGYLVLVGVYGTNTQLSNKKWKVELKTQCQLVSYKGMSGSTFTECSLQSTPNIAAWVFPVSIWLSDNKEYLDKGIVQIGNEWLQYNSKQESEFLVYDGTVELNKSPFPSESKVVGSIGEATELGRSYAAKINEILADRKISFRAQDSTIESSHTSGSDVIPAFLVASNVAGRHDVVTIINNNSSDQKEEMTVNWAANHTGSGDVPSGNWVAFTKNVTKGSYVPSGNLTRLLKFPSGELPTKLCTLYLGGLTPDLKRSTSPESFTLDEVRIQSLSQKYNVSIAATGGISPTAEDISLDSSGGLREGGGAIKVGDEVIGYTGYKTEDTGRKLDGVKRGYLGTSSGTHATGTPVMPLWFLKVTKLASDISANSECITISDSNGFPKEGYVKIDDELIGYTQCVKELTMPKGLKEHGLFRGRFGTSSSAHCEGSLVYAMPFRYHDRSAIGYDGTELAYFYAAKTARRAIWIKLGWEEELCNMKDYIGIRILARIDGKPSWDNVPTNKPGGIFQFENTNEDNILGVIGDTLEVRVFFIYKKNSYPHPAWKTTPQLKSLNVEYIQPVTVLEQR